MSVTTQIIPATARQFLNGHQQTPLFRVPDAPTPPSDETMTDASKAMMLMLIEMGMNPQAIGALMLTMAGHNIQHIRYMTGPVITHRSAWMDMLPPWIVPAIYKDRLEQIFIEAEAGEEVATLATYAEGLAYMYPASMEAPLSNEWSNIYFWLSQEVIPKHGRVENIQELCQLMGQDRPVTLSDYEFRYMLNPLLRKIRKGVVEEAARREKQEARQAKNVDQAEMEGDSASIISHIVQPDLFEEVGL